jgi:putative flippase GtrA
MRAPGREIAEFVRSGRFRRLVRYGSVSVISAVGSLTILFVTYHVLKVGSAVACNILAAGVMTVPAYYLNRRWTWGKTGRSHMFKEVLPFWAIAAMSLVLSTVVVGFAAHNANHVTHSSLGRALLVVAANFLTYATIWIGRYLIYNRYMFGEATQKPAVAGPEPALELAAGLTSPAPAAVPAPPGPPRAGRSAR